MAASRPAGGRRTGRDRPSGRSTSGSRPRVVAPGNRPVSRNPGSRRPSGRSAAARSAATADPPPRRRRSSLTGRAAVVLLVIGALVVSYAQSLKVWYDQTTQIHALQAQIADSQAKIGTYDDEIARWQDPNFVRAQARQRFAWVMPGETGYRVIGKNGQALGAEPAPTGPAPGTKTAPNTWYTRLYGSVQTAGRVKLPTTAATSTPTGTTGTRSPTTTRPTSPTAPTAPAAPTTHRAPTSIGTDGVPR